MEKPKDDSLKDVSKPLLEDLEIQCELSDQCLQYIEVLRRTFRWYYSFFRRQAVTWYRRYKTTKEELEACRRAAQVPGEPRELPPCAQADIDYKNVLGQYGKLGDAVDSLEGIREDVYELEPEADAQDAYNSLDNVMTSLDRVYDTLKDAYQQFPGI